MSTDLGPLQGTSWAQPTQWHRKFSSLQDSHRAPPAPAASDLNPSSCDKNTRRSWRDAGQDARVKLSKLASPRLSLQRSGWSGSRMRRETSESGNKSSLASFVPRCLHQQIARQSELKGLDLEFDGVATSISGAVLFADASGFTALTERLSLEPNGAERMCEIINKFFSILIDIVAEYGGDVVKFAGDALSILFAVGEVESQGQSTDMCTAVSRAMKCSLDIHAQLHNYLAFEHDTNPSKNIHLSLHMGVGCGQLTAIHVGGVFDRFEYVIAGSPMSQVAIAEPLATSGETVVSPEAFEYLKKYVSQADDVGTEYGYKGYKRVRALDEIKYDKDLKCMSPTLRELSTLEHDAILRRYVPAAVTTRWSIGEDMIDQLTELREISVLFIVAHGVDLTAEKNSLMTATEKGQALMLEIQRHIFANEGSINKMLVDDKGLLTVAVFGLPPLPHENDPERAIRSARSLVKHISRVGPNVSCNVGVTTGTAFCGVIGSIRRREYTVMGDMVNLAARLMAAADINHPVLCDEFTHKSAMETYEFEALDPLQVKGKEKAVKLYSPIADKVEDQILASSNSCGRQSELAKCRAKVAELCTYRNGGIMAITGDYGNGRCDVVKSLPEIAEEAGMQFLGQPRPTWVNSHDVTSAESSLNAAELEAAMVESGICQAWAPVIEAIMSMDSNKPLQQYLDAEWQTSISDLNYVISKPSTQFECHAEYVDQPTPMARENRIAKMITSIVLNISKEKRIFILLHLETIVGNHFKDRRSWEIASKLAELIKKRDGNLPALVIAVTSMPIYESTIVDLPVEVGHIKEVADLEHSWITLKPMDNNRRRQYLFTTLCQHGHELTIDDVPQQLVDFVGDFASGAPRYIDLLVNALVDQHIITLKQTELFNGRQASFRCASADLLTYCGLKADCDDPNGAKIDIRKFTKICRVPKKLIGAARSRYDRLVADKRSVLKRACVVPGFSIQMMSRLLGVDINEGQTSLSPEIVNELVYELIEEDFLVKNEFVGAAVRTYDENAVVSFSFQCRLLQVETYMQLLQSDRDMFSRALEAMAEEEAQRLNRQRRPSKTQINNQLTIAAAVGKSNQRSSIRRSYLESPLEVPPTRASPDIFIDGAIEPRQKQRARTMSPPISLSGLSRSTLMDHEYKAMINSVATIQRQVAALTETIQESRLTHAARSPRLFFRRARKNNRVAPVSALDSANRSRRNADDHLISHTPEGRQAVLQSSTCTIL